MARPATSPQLVVKLEGGTPTFENGVLRDVITSSRVEETQVYVVRITGVFRSGKSFLLNLMQTFLDHLCQVL